MKWSLDARITRAAELAKSHPAARELLSFYRQLALFQKQVNATEIQALVNYFPVLLDLVRREGPQPLANVGAAHLQTAEAQVESLLSVWEHRDASEAVRFYARVLLQPFAEQLASRGPASLDTEPGPTVAQPTCPFCSARPVAGVLRGEGDGAKRWLLCSLCSTEWPFRRVVCPNCGEQDKEKLPVYTAADFDHVRVDACDSCKTYIKSIDLTRDGHAVPVVDELATVPLNIWAENHGYAKIETNLLGL